MSDLYVTFLDAQFRRLYILEDYISLIWTERFSEGGDFDLVSTPTPDLMAILNEAVYLDLGGAERPERQLMEITTDVCVTDWKNGNNLVLKGRTLDWKLHSRIVRNETFIWGDIQTEVARMIEEAISDPDRAIENLVFVYSDISEVTVTSYFYGEFVDNAIQQLCQSKQLGFYVVHNKVSNLLEFRLREGRDRTPSQSVNRVVSFTSSLNNLLKSTFTNGVEPYRNVCFVMGEPNEYGLSPILEIGRAQGEKRKELFYRPNIPRGTLGENEYLYLLVQKGEEELAKHPKLKTFDGQIDSTSYRYGVDYNMGDILFLADGFGHTGRCRVTEMIYSQNKSGRKIYPTFVFLAERSEEPPPDS